MYLDKDPYLLKSGINFAPFLSRDLHQGCVTSQYDRAYFISFHVNHLLFSFHKVKGPKVATRPIRGSSRF